MVIGAATTRRLGSMHNPELARQALEESKNDVESLLSRHSVVIVIGTGGKGTGAGTIFPLAQMARQQKKLVIPVFVRPSFERHEVEKRRYDHALQVAGAIRFGGNPVDGDPERPRVHRRASRAAVGRVGAHEPPDRQRAPRTALRPVGSVAGRPVRSFQPVCGCRDRLRIGFSELNPPVGQEPGDDQIHAAVRGCWENPYCAFNGPAGTSLVCIQGDWSNVVDGKIKGQLAALALRDAAESPYNPLYARAFHVPASVGRDHSVCRVHRKSSGYRHRLERGQTNAPASHRRVRGGQHPAPLKR